MSNTLGVVKVKVVRSKLVLKRTLSRLKLAVPAVALECTAQSQQPAADELAERRAAIPLRRLSW